MGRSCPAWQNGARPPSSRLFAMWAVVVRHGGRCATKRRAPSERKAFQRLRASPGLRRRRERPSGRHQASSWSAPVVVSRVRLLSRDPYVFARRTPVSCVSQPWPDDRNHGIPSSQTPSTRSSPGARPLHHPDEEFVLVSPANLVRSSALPLTTPCLPTLRGDPDPKAPSLRPIQPELYDMRPPGGPRLGSPDQGAGGKSPRPGLAPRRSCVCSPPRPGRSAGSQALPDLARGQVRRSTGRADSSQRFAHPSALGRRSV